MGRMKESKYIRADLFMNKIAESAFFSAAEKGKIRAAIEKELGEDVKPVVHIYRECGTTMDEDESYTERGLEDDAVYDLWTPIPVRSPAGGWTTIDTGIHIASSEGAFVVGKLESKSGLNVKRHIGRLGCVIDADHTGNIVMKLYNLGKQDYIFRAGDKIAQMVIQRVPISASNR